MQVDNNKKSLQGLLNTVPQTIAVRSSNEIVEKTYISNPYTCLTVLESSDPELDLSKWLLDNNDLVIAAYEENRNLLFRGFKPCDSKQAFPKVVKQLTGSELLDYTEPSTPRTQIGEKVYTSTEFPEEEYIVQHNEHSYSSHWPLKVFFYCDTPSTEGGKTPICNSRSVYNLLSDKVKKEFEEKEVLYVRNFTEELDINWQDFFKTSSKEEVAEYCRKKHIQLTWKDNDELRTSQKSQAILIHPETGEKVWFNQAHLFHVSNLQEEVSSFLLSNYGEDNLPRNAYYGDGSSIKNETLFEIKEAYSKAMLFFDWLKGDLLMLDNVQYSHGRTPYKGKRSVMVAMTNEYPSHDYSIEHTKKKEQQNHTKNLRKGTASYYLDRTNQITDYPTLKYKLALANRMMSAFNLDEGGISGHISLKVPDRENAFWVNPFGITAEEVTPDNLIMVDENGKVVEGSYPVNVAGFCIHATIHKMYPNIHCVVHTHSLWNTVFSTLNRNILLLDQNCCMFLENHALYKHYNGPVNDTDDAQNIARTLDGKNAIILANHGALTCGEDIETAVMYMIALEKACRLNVLALQIGEYALVENDVARITKEWISNPIGFAIEFEALQRKVERLYPDLQSLKPKK